MQENTLDKKSIRNPYSIFQLLTTWTVWAAMLVIVPCVTGEEPQSVKQLLHIRYLERGLWIGWVDTRNERTSVKIPQTKAEIEQFAQEHGAEIEWHIDRPEPVDAAPDLVWTTSHQAADAAADKETSPQPSPPPREEPLSIKPIAVVEPPQGGPASAAEQTTRLERTIAADKERLESLRIELTHPDSEYQQAEAQFKAAEQELAAKRATVAMLKPLDKPAELKEAEDALLAMQAKHELARQRFDLAIQTRKTLNEQAAALEAKTAQDRLALDKLTGAAAPMSGHNTAIPLKLPDTSPAQPSTTTPLTAVVTPTASPPTSAATAVSPAPTATPADLTPVASETLRAEVVQAQQRADQKKEVARAAEREAQSVTERLKALEKTIELEQKLFVAARKKADIAFQQQGALQDEYQKQSDAGAPRTELQSLNQKVDDAERLFAKSRAEVAERTDRLSELQSERTALQSEELAALKDAADKRGEAVHAEEEVSTLKNPFVLNNILQWLLDHGMKIVLILSGILLLRMLLALTTKRLAGIMVNSGARGTAEEREDRAKTLVGVFQNAGSLAIIVAGSLMICEEVGIAVGPLMGGAAVVGLAVAFGAQNLIRDYFYGFVILLENQYKINDILKIGDIAGQVERITLRMTVLRDLEGRVHFIPNGKIDSVTNMTHGWSRAVFDIGVAYKEDADEVMKVLMELARGLQQDPQYARMIIDDPEMLGVDSFEDSAVVLKFLIKTRPLKQWMVKRELLRRIKRRFDELGIEIPFPHRTVYHTRAAEDKNNDEFFDRRAA